MENNYQNEFMDQSDPNVSCSFVWYKP